MSTAELNLTMRQGATYELSLALSSEEDGTGVTLDPIDITDWQIRMHIRKSSLDPVTTITVTNPIVDDPELAEENNLPAKASTITIEDGPNGKFKIYLSALFNKLRAKGIHKFEIDVVDDDLNVNTLFAGEIELEGDIK